MEREKTKVRVSINGLPESPSKAEEVAIVAQLVEKFHGRQWYLSSLFSTSFLAWFEKRVADDWSCDLIGEMEKDKKDVFIAEAEWHKSDAKFESTARAFDLERSATTKRYEGEIAKVKEELERVMEHRKTVVDNIEHLRQETVRLDRELQKQVSENREIVWNNTELKAKLYDLTTENERLNATLKDLRDPDR